MTVLNWGGYLNLIGELLAREGLEPRLSEQEQLFARRRFVDPHWQPWRIAAAIRLQRQMRGEAS
jgi:hypothetical protein